MNEYFTMMVFLHKMQIMCTFYRCACHMCFVVYMHLCSSLFILYFVQYRLSSTDYRHSVYKRPFVNVWCNFDKMIMMSFWTVFKNCK